MSKTVRQKSFKDEDQVSKLKNKLSDRKEQVLRLKRRIRELEKQLESKGKPVPVDEYESKKDSRKKAEKPPKKDTKKELIEALRIKFGKGEKRENS